MATREPAKEPTPGPGSRIPGPACSGIVLLDKPQGLGSNAALQKVKRALGAAKAGHAGTLDPLATGMLPILLGEATKVAGCLLHKDKAYRVTCRLGQITDTYDAEGAVLEQRPVPALDIATVESHLARFTGIIRQRAPIYSAIKQQGQPLYRRVRRGEDVVAPERQVRIHGITVLALAGNLVDLEVVCGSGTYIRSLAHDLGQALGCGGHVASLRRLWVEPFRNSPMASLERVLAGEVAPLPAVAAVSDWQRLVLDTESIAWLRQGRRLPGSGQTAGQRLAAVDASGQLVGLVAVTPEGELQPQRLLLD